MLIRCFALLFCLTVVSAVERSAYPMGDRIFADKGSKISFRYPFSYKITDNYYPGVLRPGSGTGGWVVVEPGEGPMTEEQLRKKMREMLKNPDHSKTDWDVEMISFTEDELPTEIRGQDFVTIAKHISRVAEVDFQAYDYYGDLSERPHAEAKFAPKGVEALRGEGGDHSAIALKYDDRYSVVVCNGGESDSDNYKILNSIEVMVEKRGKMMTWRQAACASRQVLGRDGKPQRIGNGSKASWATGWEFETEHYHITTNVSPKHAALYGQQMEALYKAFAEIYRPERFPPHKMEIMVYKDHRDFQGGAAAVGIPVGATTLGLFAYPPLLCIMAFETYEKKGDRTTFATLAHEASHQFLHMACNGSRHVPTWINEGIAVYFESSEVSGGKLKINLPKGRLGQLYYYYSDQKTTVWPVDTYLNHYGHIPALNYGEAFVMVHFWIFGVRGGKERFQKYWQRLLKGDDGTEAFEEEFMEDLVKKFGSRGAALEEVQKLMVQYQKKLK